MASPFPPYIIQRKRLTYRQRLACEWLIEHLEPDVDVRGIDVYKNLRLQGFGDKVIAFACAHLRIKKRKNGVGPGSFWIWTLPSADRRPVIEASDAPAPDKHRTTEGWLKCNGPYCEQTTESFDAAREAGWWFSKAPSGFWLKFCPGCQGNRQLERIVDKEAY